MVCKSSKFQRPENPVVGQTGNCGDVKWREKALRTNKPDSVIRQRRTPSFIWDRPHGRPQAAYPPARASSPSIPIARDITGVHDISTRKVYPPSRLLGNAVRSYRTFSPLSRVLGTVIFCDTLCAPAFAGAPPVRWCGALRCPDFPPLSRRWSSPQCGAKVGSLLGAK